MDHGRKDWFPARMSRSASAFLFLCALGLVSLAALAGGAIIAPMISEGSKFKQDEFVALVGIVFTMASLIVALFGVLSYFQSSDAFKRIAILETELLWSKQDVISTKVFHRLLAKIRFLPVTDDGIPTGSLSHLYTLASSQDESVEYNDRHVETALLELYNAGGLEIIEQIHSTILELGPHGHSYTKLARHCAVYIPIFRGQ
jgi:hypothetical protein